MVFQNADSPAFPALVFPAIFPAALSAPPFCCAVFRGFRVHVTFLLKCYMGIAAREGPSPLFWEDSGETMYDMMRASENTICAGCDIE
jgi:hypothetical protein